MISTSNTKEEIELKELTSPSVLHAQPKHSRQPWYLLGFKIFAWQVAAILAVEGALFAAGLGEEEIYKLDPELGFRHMSNKRITWRSEGLATSYFNEDGLREPGASVAKAAGVYRIALLGDSLTESLQVSNEQSFGHLVQEQLKNDLKMPVQVLNFGTSGYSTAQEYLQLKKQVLQYKPDLVLLCYNSRDCFENWSPPDEVLTNVRPAALHLPGGKLAVDSSPVALWMRSPRAKFLKQVDWLRQNSRLWGLISAAELDLSMHNEAYKRVVFFLTKPGKAIRKTSAEISDWWKETTARLKSAPNSNATKALADSVQLGTTPTAGTSTITSSTGPSPTAAPTTAPGVVSEAAQISATQAAADQAAADQAAAASANYRSLISRTLGSLLLEMKKESAGVGARFAVVALPVRAALSIRSGMESKFCDMDYNDELRMLEQLCKQDGIPMFNTQNQALGLDEKEKDYLFYLVHLTPRGHKFVASQLAPAVAPLLVGKEKP